MKRWQLFWGLIALLPFSSAVAADLTVAQAKAAFAKADAELNVAWSEAKEKLPEAAFNELREEQRGWVEYRDYMATSPMYTGKNGDEETIRESAAYSEAAAGLTESRTSWLKGLVAPLPDGGSLTGRWIDSYGGHIDLVENDHQLHFSMEVVRGPTSHLGSITGIAAWNDPIGWFSDKGREEGKEDETNLSFILRSNQLEVIGANTMWYHGARAYFDGRYTRVADLSAEEQLSVMKSAASGQIREQ